MSKINSDDFGGTQPSNLPEVKKPNLARQLKVLGISIAVIIACFGLFGWLIGGVEGAKGGLVWGLVLTLLAAPSLLLLFVAKPLSEFSGRWGAHNFKKHLEGDHSKQEEQDKW